MIQKRLPFCSVLWRDKFLHRRSGSFNDNGEGIRVNRMNVALKSSRHRDQLRRRDFHLGIAVSERQSQRLQLPSRSKGKAHRFIVESVPRDFG